MNDKGLVTYDRKVKKDAYFFYKATWTNAPVVYITSRRYTPRTTAPVDVKVYSNCDSVELKLNGISQDKKTGTDRIFKWKGIGLSAEKNSVEAVDFKGKKPAKTSAFGRGRKARQLIQGNRMHHRKFYWKKISPVCVIAAEK